MFVVWLSQWTKNPIKIEIEPEHVAVESVKQVVYIVTTEDKKALLYNIIARQDLERVIVFCNRRDETRRVTDLLLRYQVNCALISGEITQTKRIRALEDFRNGKIRVLVATDVAGRGLHIEGISHVINYTLPHDPEDYVHRIGRTGRAGATGISISFACEEDSFHLPDIEALLGHPLPCTHPEESWLIFPPKPKSKPKSGNKQGTPNADSEGLDGNRLPVTLPIQNVDDLGNAHPANMKGQNRHRQNKRQRRQLIYERSRLQTMFLISQFVS